MSAGNTATPPAAMQRAKAVGARAARVTAGADHDPLDPRQVADSARPSAQPAAASSSATARRLARADLERQRTGRRRAAAATSRRMTSRPSGAAEQRLARLVAPISRGSDARPRPRTAGWRRRRRAARRRRRAGRPPRTPRRARAARRSRARPSSAPGLSSVATTLRSGRSSLSASAIAPEPVPTSTTRAPCGRSSAASTTCSVSGRGISTRASTASSMRAEALAAEDVGDGLALARRRAAVDERARLVRLEPALGVGDQRGAVDPEHVRQQHLGVEPRRLAAGGAERDRPRSRARRGRSCARAAAGPSGRRRPRAARASRRPAAPPVSSSSSPPEHLRRGCGR